MKNTCAVFVFIFLVKRILYGNNKFLFERIFLCKKTKSINSGNNV